MRTSIVVFASAAVVLVVACGGSSSSDAPPSPAGGAAGTAGAAGAHHAGATTIAGHGAAGAPIGGSAGAPITAGAGGSVAGHAGGSGQGGAITAGSSGSIAGGSSGAGGSIVVGGAGGDGGSPEVGGSAGEAGFTAVGGAAGAGGDGSAGSAGDGSAGAAGAPVGVGGGCVTALGGFAYARADGTIFDTRGGGVAITIAGGAHLTNAVQTHTSTAHGCALLGDGTVWCWAAQANGNADGQLGNGAAGGNPTPFVASQVLVSAATPLVGITSLPQSSTEGAPVDHHCALRGSDGAMFCWGPSKQVIPGVTGDAPFATQILADATTPLDMVGAIALGPRHACVNRAGVVMCWGDNTNGEVGIGTTAAQEFPITVAGLPAGVLGPLGAGSDDSCVVVDGHVWCWGDNTHGQIGSGDGIDDGGCPNACATKPHEVFVDPGSPLAVIGVLQVGVSAACAVTDPGNMWCWGQATAGDEHMATQAESGGIHITQVVLLTNDGVGVDSFTEVLQDASYYRDDTLGKPVCK